MSGGREESDVHTTELGEEDSGSDSGRSILREIRVVHGPEGGVLPHSVLGDALTLGRDPAVSPALRLADTQVSREHARIEADRPIGEVRIVDCESRNGTYVDGSRVDRAQLLPGSVIRVGRTLVLYDAVSVRPDDPLSDETDTLLGPSFAMRQLRGWLALVAPRALPVLILGESGVGKECVAREIHRMSGLKGSFVPVNCAAIPAELAESELFGHAAGAFSGARQASEGLMCAADGGTLLLDEIGELPLLLQAKLLRALADGEVRPVGRTDARRVEVRVIASTNRDLAAQIEQERFRRDLYARLEGWTIVVPPLRTRRSDILGLARTFLDREAPKTELSLGAAELLLRYDWPGNVRELQQALAAAAARAAGRPLVRVEDLPPTIAAGGSTEDVGSSVRGKHPAAPDAAELRRVLALYEGNIAQTAQHFGKGRQQIYRWAARYGIDLSAAHPPGPKDQNGA